MARCGRPPSQIRVWPGAEGAKIGPSQFTKNISYTYTNIDGAREIRLAKNNGPISLVLTILVTYFRDRRNGDYLPGNSSVSSHDEDRREITLQGSVEKGEALNIQHVDLINEEYLVSDDINAFNFTQMSHSWAKVSEQTTKY